MKENAEGKITCTKHQLYRDDEPDRFSAGFSYLDTAILYDWRFGDIGNLCFDYISDGFLEDYSELEQSMLRVVGLLEELSFVIDCDCNLHTMELFSSDILLDMMR